MSNEQRMRLEPDNTTVAIAKRMNPRETMVGARDHNQALGFQNLFVPVKRTESVEELGQSVKMGWGVAAHIHHEVPQSSGLDLVSLAAFRSGPMQRFREPRVKL